MGFSSLFGQDFLGGQFEETNMHLAAHGVKNFCLVLMTWKWHDRISGTERYLIARCRLSISTVFFAIEIAGMWENGGDAGADVVAADEGGVADFDAGNIGDRVQRAGREDADLQPEIGGAWAWLGSCVLGGSERGDQEDRGNGEKLVGHGRSIRSKLIRE